MSSGRSLYDMALIGGNRALHSQAQGLAPGSPADIVMLACDYESLAARERRDTIFDRFIFGGSSGYQVESVWVRGRQVVANGRHLGREAIAAAFRKTLQRVLSA